ncbi:leucine-rich repeat-containing protein 31 [Neosynchiropus ocellatus]
MESAGQRSSAPQRRSTLDLIMSQIRRKRTGPERRPLGRFLSWTAERSSEDRGRSSGEGSPGGGVMRRHSALTSDPPEEPQDLGWGRVCVGLQKLGKRSDSKTLSLSHCDVTVTELLELASLLQLLPLLEELDLAWNPLVGGGLGALTSHLRQVGRLKTLRLCSCRLDADDVTALGEALGSVPLLEVLDLSWNGGVGGALQGLLGKLHPTLKELHLASCRLTAHDAALLGEALLSLPRLWLLDVSGNHRLGQDVEGFGALASSLRHAASIGTLRLRSCGLSGPGLDLLGSSLRCLASVRELDLSTNKSLSGQLHRLTVHLSHLTQLEVLDLHLCGLTRSDVGALVQVLPCLPALTELDVSANAEVGGALQPLVSALPLARLRRLPLNNCRLSEASVAAAALALPGLLSVDVSWSKVVGGRLSLLLGALQPGVAQELLLSSCELTAEDLQQLGAASRRGLLTALRVLDVSYNGSVGEGGWAALFSAADGLGSLEDLDLSLRPTGAASCSAWMPALLGALPRLQTLTRLAMQRWTMSAQERRRLEHAVRRRSLLLELQEGEPRPHSGSERSCGQESPEGSAGEE